MISSLQRYVSSYLIPFLATLGLCLPIGAWSTAALAQGASCECPDSTCGPCEIEKGVKFYTEKCGEKLDRVRSCKKPKCVAVPDQNQCFARLGMEPPPVTPEPPKEAAAKPTDENESDRTPAAVMGEGAEVVLAVGDSRVNRQNSNKQEKIKNGDRVFVGDQVLTGADGRVRLRFPELSEVFVSPSSTVMIETAMIKKSANGAPAKRKIMIDLMSGRIRSRVQGRYNDGQSSFQVKTKAAVAGVRGTDFVTTYSQDGGNWTTEVRTLTGDVQLTGANGKHVAVSASTYASYVVPEPRAGSNAVEIEAAVSLGVLSPAFKMSEEDLKLLEEATNLGFGKSASLERLDSKEIARRLPAGDDDALCHGPSGDFNQCAWSCEGNPKGEKRCRTDMPGVACIRRLCRANGQWAEPSKLTPKEGARCDAQRPTVMDCGTYW